MHHKGAIRTAFSQPEDFGLLDRFWVALNKFGSSRSEYSFFVFHRKSRFRKSVKRVVKSWYVRCVCVCVCMCLCIKIFNPFISAQVLQAVHGTGDFLECHIPVFISTSNQRRHTPTQSNHSELFRVVG